MEPATPLFFLFTDFGTNGPYLGQMEAVIAQRVPDAKVINLINNAPATEPRYSAYLLAALAQQLPVSSMILAVIDPGVGSNRLPLLVEADKRYYLGPDNGLLSRVMAQADDAKAYKLDYPTADLSDSFHGRDLFAPAAADLFLGHLKQGAAVQTHELQGADWQAELIETIYIDHFGNVFTGLQGGSLKDEDLLSVADRTLRYARTFSEVNQGEVFWYRNSSGLVEIAVNQGRAADVLGIGVGDSINVIRS